MSTQSGPTPDAPGVLFGPNIPDRADHRPASDRHKPETRMSDREMTAQLMDRLRRHYIQPGKDVRGGVFVHEVGVNGSWGAGNRCDAIYVGFTSTSGRLLVGHEVKASRADWLNELKHTTKADTWADQCHEWWLVVPHPSVVQEGELPVGWGLMSPSGRTRTRMKIHVPAARKPEDHAPAWGAVRSVMARIDTLQVQEMHAYRDDAEKRALTVLDEKVEIGVERRMREVPDVDELRDQLSALIDALGVKIDWRADESGFRRLSRASLADVERIGRALKTSVTVEAALRRLYGPWSHDVIGQIEGSLQQLRSSLAPIGHLGSETEEEIGSHAS